MIEEIIWAFDSPGSMSAALIFRSPMPRFNNGTRGRHGPETTEMCRAGLLRSRRSELVGCGVRLGQIN